MSVQATCTNCVNGIGNAGRSVLNAVTDGAKWLGRQVEYGFKWGWEQLLKLKTAASPVFQSAVSFASQNKAAAAFMILSGVAIGAAIVGLLGMVRPAAAAPAPATAVAAAPAVQAAPAVATAPVAGTPAAATI